LPAEGRGNSRNYRAIFIQDIEEIHGLRLRLKEKEAAVCYFHVDNYDEIMAACPEENRPELLAKIDKTVTQWVHNYNGLIRKYDDDKYLVILNFGDFQKAEEAKFDILDAVREI